MISTDKMKAFNKYALEKLYFYVESKFWSKPCFSDLQDWLGNFKSTEEKYCSLKLLDRFVFYSEEDIVQLIKFGLFEKISKRHILSIENKSNFQVTNEVIQKEKSSFLKTLFVLPLSTGNQSESSLAMLRYLTNSIGFPQENILDINKLTSEQLQKCKNLVIIDDFIGSGKQIKDFWNTSHAVLDGKQIYFNQVKDLYSDIDLEYFCLVCTEEGYDNFKHDYDIGIRNDLRITYGEMLTSKFKVFGKDSIYFDNDEIEECKNIIQSICINNGFDLLGYQGLDYAIAFHHDIPDCSLPLFYIKDSNWNHLFRNKKTEIYA